jgi:hypothetical protein
VVEKEGSSSSGVDTELSGVRRWSHLQISGRAGRAEREMWAGGRLGAAWRKENGREGGRGAARQHGPHGQDGSEQCGQRWQCALVAEAAWRTGEGGGVRATRCGVVDRWGRAAIGPSVSGGVEEGEG